MSDDLTRAALQGFIDTIETTGGICWDTDNDGYATVADPTWGDLALAYIQACSVLGRDVVMDRDELVDLVKQHAIDNYEAGGWDVIVECWEDKEILDILDRDKANTPQAAIESFKPVVSVWADRQADAKNSEF